MLILFFILMILIIGFSCISQKFKNIFVKTILWIVSILLFFVFLGIVSNNV